MSFCKHANSAGAQLSTRLPRPNQARLDRPKNQTRLIVVRARDTHPSLRQADDGLLIIHDDKRTREEGRSKHTRIRQIQLQRAVVLVPIITRRAPRQLPHRNLDRYRALFGREGQVQRHVARDDRAWLGIYGGAVIIQQAGRGEEGLAVVLEWDGQLQRPGINETVSRVVPAQRLSARNDHRLRDVIPDVGRSRHNGQRNQLAGKLGLVHATGQRAAGELDARVRVGRRRVHPHALHRAGHGTALEQAGAEERARGRGRARAQAEDAVVVGDGEAVGAVFGDAGCDRVDEGHLDVGDAAGRERGREGERVVGGRGGLEDLGVAAVGVGGDEGDGFRGARGAGGVEEVGGFGVALADGSQVGRAIVDVVWVGEDLRVWISRSAAAEGIDTEERG